MNTRIQLNATSKQQAMRGRMARQKKAHSMLGTLILKDA